MQAAPSTVAPALPAKFAERLLLQVPRLHATSLKERVIGLVSVGAGHEERLNDPTGTYSSVGPCSASLQRRARPCAGQASWPVADRTSRRGACSDRPRVIRAAIADETSAADLAAPYQHGRPWS